MAVVDIISETVIVCPCQGVKSNQVMRPTGRGREYAQPSCSRPGVNPYTQSIVVEVILGLIDVIQSKRGNMEIRWYCDLLAKRALSCFFQR